MKISLYNYVKNPFTWSGCWYRLCLPATQKGYALMVISVNSNWHYVNFGKHKEEIKYSTVSGMDEWCSMLFLVLCYHPYTFSANDWWWLTFAFCTTGYLSIPYKGWWGFAIDASQGLGLMCNNFFSILSLLMEIELTQKGYVLMVTIKLKLILGNIKRK